jgi:hypothetical protein
MDIALFLFAGNSLKRLLYYEGDPLSRDQKAEKERPTEPWGKAMVVYIQYQKAMTQPSRGF